MDISSLVAGQSSPFGCGSKRICSRGHGSLFGALNPTRSGLLHKISASLLNFCLEMLTPREESDEARGGGGAVSRVTAPGRGIGNSKLRLGPTSPRANCTAGAELELAASGRKERRNARAQGNGHPGTRRQGRRAAPAHGEQGARPLRKSDFPPCRPLLDSEQPSPATRTEPRNLASP